MKYNEKVGKLLFSKCNKPKLAIFKRNPFYFVGGVSEDSQIMKVRESASGTALKIPFENTFLYESTQSKTPVDTCGSP